MSTERDEPLGGCLRGFREAAGLSQEELARRAGLSAGAVGAIERGKRKRPYPYTLRALADTLGLSSSERTMLLAAAGKTAIPEDRERVKSPRVKLSLAWLLSHPVCRPYLRPW